MPGTFQRKTERSVGFMSSQCFEYKSSGEEAMERKTGRKGKNNPDYLLRHHRSFDDFALAWEMSHWIVGCVEIDAFYVTVKVNKLKGGRLNP